MSIYRCIGEGACTKMSLAGAFTLPFKMALSLILTVGCITSWEGPENAKVDSDLDVMSLNIHYYVPSDDDTDWENRRHAVSASIIDVNPDIILFQEMETFVWGNGSIPDENVQLDWVMSTVAGYTAGAAGNEPEVFPITQPILFRSDRFDLVNEGFFYFSDEPDLIYSQPWSGQWPSYSTWVRLYDRELEQEFLVVNTHLNAFSSIDKSNGVNLILERIELLGNDQPVVLGGDFNVFLPDRRLNQIMRAGMKLVRNEGSTFHFGSGVHLYPAIDHFFVSQEWSIIDGGVLQKQWNNDWPSDHHPIVARLRL